MYVNCLKFEVVKIASLISTPKSQAEKRPNKPVSGSDIHLNKGFKKSIKTIEKTACSHFYRPDLRRAAIARYSALYHDQRTKKEVGKRAKATAIKKARTSKRV